MRTRATATRTGVSPFTLVVSQPRTLFVFLLSLSEGRARESAIKKKIENARVCVSGAKKGNRGRNVKAEE